MQEGVAHLVGRDRLLVVQNVGGHPPERMDDSRLLPEILVLDYFRPRLNADHRIGLAEGEGYKQEARTYAFHAVPCDM